MENNFAYLVTFLTLCIIAAVTMNSHNILGGQEEIKQMICSHIVV